MASDPFETLDEDGVGELIKLAMARGHKTRPDMKMGICGEHGGDPTSIDFCQRTFCIRIHLSLSLFTLHPCPPR